jgi:hypothetical protein
MEETANILNKKPPTAENGWSLSLKIVRRLTTNRKNKLVTKCHRGPQTWADSFGEKCIMRSFIICAPSQV